MRSSQKGLVITLGQYAFGHLDGPFVKYRSTVKSGEISPKEFAQFIGKEMRLSKVEYAPRAESGPIFNFQSLIENYE